MAAWAAASSVDGLALHAANSSISGRSAIARPDFITVSEPPGANQIMQQAARQGFMASHLEMVAVGE
jgi:hypothetical protein